MNNLTSPIQYLKSHLRQYEHTLGGGARNVEIRRFLNYTIQKMKGGQGKAYEKLIKIPAENQSLFVTILKCLNQRTGASMFKKGILVFAPYPLVTSKDPKLKPKYTVTISRSGSTIVVQDHFFTVDSIPHTTKDARLHQCAVQLRTTLKIQKETNSSFRVVSFEGQILPVFKDHTLRVGCDKLAWCRDEYENDKSLLFSMKCAKKRNSVYSKIYDLNDQLSDFTSRKGSIQHRNSNAVDFERIMDSVSINGQPLVSEKDKNNMDLDRLRMKSLSKLLTMTQSADPVGFLQMSTEIRGTPPSPPLFT